MKKYTVFEAIDERYSRLSKTHRKIADFLRKHYDQAVFMTARKLAERLQTSESTVVRFAVSIGFDGYPELQQNLRDNIKTILTTKQKLTTKLEPMSFEGSLRTSFNRDISDIRATADALQAQDIHDMAQAIQDAKRVFILGQRSSKILVDYLNFYLSFLHSDVVSFHQNVGDFFDQVVGIEEGDVVVVISFPRYSSSTINMAEIIKKQGSKIYAITDSPEAPITSYAELSIYASYSIDSFIDSHVAPMALINALITAIAYDNLESATEKFQKLEEIWEEYSVYL